MAGYYAGEEEHTGPHRAAAQFDTMNLGEPHRAAPFDTMNVGAGPHRVAQFDTMNLGAPVRTEAPNAKGGEEAASYYPPAPAAATPGYAGGGGHTPINSSLDSKPTGMHSGLVIASLALRGAAAVSLIIALAVLASDSQTVDGVHFSFSSFSSTKYALAVAIIGAVYSIYETISTTVRLAMGHSLLPGKASIFLSYIADQVVIVLLLTGASAAAATFKNLNDLQLGNGDSFCTIFSNLCSQGVAGVAMIFIGFCFLAASLVISSFCFYKNKI